MLTTIRFRVMYTCTLFFCNVRVYNNYHYCITFLGTSVNVKYPESLGVAAIRSTRAVCVYDDYDLASYKCGLK